jgi:hypothetical protein
MLLRFIPNAAVSQGMNTMNALMTFFSALLNRRNNASAARQLLERADQARGQSRGDAAELRSNALAMLSVVR